MCAVIGSDFFYFRPRPTWYYRAVGVNKCLKNMSFQTHIKTFFKPVYVMYLITLLGFEVLDIYLTDSVTIPWGISWGA